MCKTPIVEPKAVLKVLYGRGYKVTTLKGSHLNLVDGQNHKVTVPLHQKISPASFLSICAQAGMEKDELARLVAG
jgi:predicted RNA binding protein YcfA (HicA-like mRNA interferase family)